MNLKATTVRGCSSTMSMYISVLAAVADVLLTCTTGCRRRWPAWYGEEIGQQNIICWPACEFSFFIKLLSPTSQGLNLSLMLFPQKLIVDFFQLGGGAGLILRWSGPGVPNMVPVPASAFRCNTNQTPFQYFDIESKGGSNSALTYARAEQLCSSQGQRLCSADELCPNGHPRPGLDKFGRTDNWIAVNNAQNEWVTFNRAGNRLCKTHTQVAGSTPAWGTQSNARGQGFERAAECCF